MVTKTDVTNTLNSLGVVNGDILLFHSSLKSFGQVDGGADAVIDGALDAVGEDGTLVAPTFVQRDFENAYVNWNKDTTPSDVGFITETLRLRDNAIRSDQATHSVAAIGKNAELLTKDHSSFGPRICIYGSYAFSYGSPWQKMYDLGGKVVFMGVDLRSNTYKHFIETRIVEKCLSPIPDCKEKDQLINRIAQFENRIDFIEQTRIKRETGEKTYYSFPFVCSGDRMLDFLASKNLVKKAYCGQSLFMIFNIKDMVDALERDIEINLPYWVPSEEAQEWIKDAEKLIKSKKSH